jgi:hypothetical protein
VSINYSSITYAVNGAGTASDTAKVIVAEITGGMIESGVEPMSTLESVLDSRYWEIFYDTRRTASMASITFTYDVVSDGIEDEEQLTVAFRADYGDDWTAWENVEVNEVDNTVTASNVDAGEGQWALAIKYNQTYVPDDNVEQALPLTFQLHNAFPNPFNPVTTLRYDLPEQANVNIIIYDMLGRQVRTLVNTTQDAGFKSVLWNATNDYGEPVSAGVYIYQIQAGEFVQTRKMVLLK